MAKEMLINVSAGEECRIAVVENGKLEELYMERASAVSHVGNVYKGKVTNVEASIQAAFVDFGIGRNGFLHVSDLMPTYWGRKGENVKESVGRKLGRRDRPPIQQCLRRGDEIIVQVIKEGLGTKGPTLSSYLSIPGRILVMMPGVGKSGVSKKIEDEEERRRLRKILDELDPPKDAGFIIRTAGVGRAKQEIERDFKYLMRLWENIEKADTKKAPLELYAEGDLVMRTVRDVYTADIDRIVVDDAETAKRIKEFFKLLMPRTKNAVDVYEGPLPLFHEYGIERDIENMHSRVVPLKSGGSLVIDQTEAVVAIDVNSGKSRQSGDAETTAFKTDLEAADEIPRQLKLRDLGGVVICDFIDLRFERHRRELEERLAENLKKDRAKTRFLQMSEFGIIEMTRQRMRPSLKKSVFHDCPGCHGHGLVKTPESMGLDVMRRIAIAANNERVRRVELSLHPDVAVQVLNRKREELADLEHQTGKRIVIKTDPELSLDDMSFELFDEREGSLWLQVLGMEPPQGSQGGGNGGGNRDRERGGRRGGRGRDRDRDRDRDRNGGHGAPTNARHDDDDDVRAELENEEDEGAVEIRPPREPDTSERRYDDRDDRFRRRGGGRDRHRDDQRAAAHAPRDDRGPIEPAPLEDDEHEPIEAAGVGDDEGGYEDEEGGYDVRTGSLSATKASAAEGDYDDEAEGDEGDEGGYDVNAGLPAEAGDAGEPVGAGAGDDQGGPEGEGQYEGGYDTGYGRSDRGPGNQGGGPRDGGHGGYDDRGGEGGGRRRRRRRRGRRGRGGEGGGGGQPQHGQQGGYGGQGGQGGGYGPGGGDQRRNRPEIYTNDPGVEEFADDVEPVSQPAGRDDRRDGRRDDRPRHGDNRGQHGHGPRHGDNRGGDRRDRDQRGGDFRRGDRDNRGGPQQPQRQPQGQGQGRGHGGGQHRDEHDRPEPGNSIHGPETHVQSRVDVGGRGGRRGRRGRGRGGKDPLAGKIPEITPDSLVAKFLEAPVPVPEEPFDDDEDYGNRVPPPQGGQGQGGQGGPQQRPFEGDDQQQGGGRRRRRRRRGGRGRGRNRDEFGNEQRPPQGGPQGEFRGNEAPVPVYGEEEPYEDDRDERDDRDDAEELTPVGEAANEAVTPEPAPTLAAEIPAEDELDDADEADADEAEADADDADEVEAKPTKSSKKAVKKTAKKTAKKAVKKVAKKAVKKTAKKSTKRASGREAAKEAAAPVAESVPSTGSSDRHQIEDDDVVELPDISQFLTKPTSPADLDVIPDYDDDE